MARVLVLSLVFPPDAVSTAQIMGDLVQDLRESGHSVFVITTTPHYNRDPDAEARQPMRRWWGRLIQRGDYYGAPVFHTAMPAKSGSVPLRLLAWALFHLLSLLVGIFSVRKVEVIIAPSPPLSIGVVAWLLGMWHRAPFIYNVQELYPDIAINLGAVRNPAMIGLLFALERFVYAKASRVTLIADRMRRRLLEKGIPPDRAVVVPNFVDVGLLQAVAAPNGFTREFGLDGKFVVCYAGNLGPAQGLETLLDASRLLADESGIVVVLVGGGTLWNALAERIQGEQLSNVRLLPHQPFARVPEIYGASDLSVVPQAANIGADAVPSKVYRIMSC
jgi:colanic acid biosynthesis glycosyl transferase WcaI